MVEDDAVPTQVRVAVALVGVEALALGAVAVFLAVRAVTGHPRSVAAALAVAAFAAGGSAVLGLGARALSRLRAAARTPVVLVQLLAIPVSYSLAVQAGRVGYGGPVLLGALAVLYLLFTPPARAALDRAPGQ